MTSQRGTCWSITINNPTEEDIKPTLPAKWALTGQMEKGAEGTPHYQGALKTPQCRFSQVKTIFPRAHIELARSKGALVNYVHKDETRLSEVSDHVSNIPTLFDYQHTIASRWDEERYMILFREHQRNRLDQVEAGEKPKTLDHSDIALIYVDELVAEDIEDGICGIEYIAINPMWRSAWKKFYRPMIRREHARMSADKDRQTDTQNSTELISPAGV